MIVGTFSKLTVSKDFELRKQCGRQAEDIKS